MGTIIDMHVHTIVGSMDSDISPRRLADAANGTGLRGLALTEHVNPWRPDEIQRLREETGLLLVNAREWSTDMGHIGVFGLPPEVRDIRRARDLRAACDEYGAFMILCHPFRYYPGPSSILFGHRRDAQPASIEDLADHPIFSLADAVEALNGGCIERENRLAQEVARYLGLPMTGGSDAHMPLEIGRYATMFEKELRDEDDLLSELRAGRFCPVALDKPTGSYLPLIGASGK